MRHNCLFIMHRHGGGAEKVCLTLLEHLPEQGYAVTVACLHPLTKACPLCWWKPWPVSTDCPSGQGYRI